MKILGLEFSSEHRSVALLETTCPAALAVAHMESGVGGFDGLVLVERVLQTSGCVPADVDVIAVGLGPGSYTGIRSAISVAQGWQLARKVQCLGVSSIDCLAQQAANEGVQGKVGVVVDAQRSEFYLGVYQIDAGRIVASDPLQLVARPAAQAPFQEGLSCVGPAAELCVPGSRVLFPDASVLVTLAAQGNAFVTADRLEPIYLREVNFVKAPR